MISPRSKTIALHVATIVTCYFVAWTAAYLFIVGTDFAYYFEYLGLFWTLDGFELPSFTGALSIIIAIPLSAVSIWLLRRLLKKKHEAA
jgi:membrane protein implicated in regulation of membrane protease activity